MKKNTTQYKLVALNTAIPIPAETENSHIAKAKAIAIGMQVGLLVNTLYDQLFVKEVKDRDPMAIVSAGTALCALAATHISAAMKSETAQETSTRLTQASKLFRLGMYATNTAQVGLKIAGNIANTPLVVLGALLSQTAKLFGVSEWIGKKAASFVDNYLPTSVSRVVKPYVEHLLPFAAYSLLPGVSVASDNSLVVSTPLGPITYQPIPVQLAQTLFPDNLDIASMSEGEVYVHVNPDNGKMTQPLTLNELKTMVPTLHDSLTLGNAYSLDRDAHAAQDEAHGYIDVSAEPEDIFYDALDYEPVHTLSRREAEADQGQNVTLTGVQGTGFGSRIQFLDENQVVISAPQGNGAVYILSSNTTVNLADGLPVGATNISSATGMKMGAVITVYDINGDKRPDVIMQGPDGMRYLLGIEGEFSPNVNFDDLPRINGTRAGDGNVQAVVTIHDGKILMASRSDGTVVLMRKGEGVFNSVPAESSIVVSSLGSHDDQLVVGTRLTNVGNNTAVGRVRLYSINPTGQNITLNMTYEGDGPGARLGAAALSFLGADGKPILVLGATGEGNFTGALHVMFQNGSSQVLRGEIPGGLFGSNLMVSRNTLFVTAQNAGIVYKFDIGNGFPANLSAAIKYSGPPQSFGTALATNNRNYVIGDPTSHRVLIFFAPSSPVTPTISPTSESSGGANIAVIAGAVVGGVVVVVVGGVVVYKEVIKPRRQVAVGQMPMALDPGNGPFNIVNLAFVPNYEEPRVGGNPEYGVLGETVVDAPPHDYATPYEVGYEVPVLYNHTPGSVGEDGHYEAAHQPVISALNWGPYMEALRQPTLPQHVYAGLDGTQFVYGSAARGADSPPSAVYEVPMPRGDYQATLRRDAPSPVPSDYEVPDDEA